MFHKQKLLVLVGLFLTNSLIAGCVSLPVEPEESLVTKAYCPPAQEGVYHKVQEGETVWRISKTYGVTIEEIIQANNIPNAAQIEKNQLVLIPGAESLKDIVLDKEDNQNDFIWPVNGKILSYFQQRDGGCVNKGIDIQVSQGEVVRAARTGRVIFADYLGGYGYTLVLDHQDSYYSIYSQNADLLVKLGDLVLKNTEISHVGNFNKLAYLHFEIRKNSVADNPLHYLP